MHHIQRQPKSPPGYDDATLIHRGRSIVQPNAFMVCRNGRKLLLKDYSCAWPAFKWLFSRRLLRHEQNILRQLQGIEGIPAVYGMADTDTLVIDYIDGHGCLQDSRELTPDLYPPLAFFEAFRTLLERVHDRGIAHGDTRRKNVLRDHRDQPYLIDFATSVSIAGRVGPLRRRLFRMLARADTVALLKIQRSYYPESLTEAETRLLDNLPWYLTAGRFLRKGLYRRLIKQRRWQQRWQRWRCRSQGRSVAPIEQQVPPTAAPEIQERDSASVPSR